MTVTHYGTTSDKNIVKFDGFVHEVRLDKKYTNAEFKLQVGHNQWITEKGVYLLVDGGCHKTGNRRMEPHTSLRFQKYATRAKWRLR